MGAEASLQITTLGSEHKVHVVHPERGLAAQLHWPTQFLGADVCEAGRAHRCCRPRFPPCRPPACAAAALQELSKRVAQAMQEAHAKSVSGMKEKMKTLAQNLGLPGLPGQ